MVASPFINERGYLCILPVPSPTLHPMSAQNFFFFTDKDLQFKKLPYH